MGRLLAMVAIVIAVVVGLAHCALGVANDAADDRLEQDCHRRARAEAQIEGADRREAETQARYRCSLHGENVDRSAGGRA
jgi:hypothetical protein